MRRNATFRLAAALTLAVALAACGSSPTGTQDPAEPAAGATDATDAIAAVSAQLEGLDFPARRAKLIELAQAEGGEVSFYASTSPEDIDPIIEAFEEQTGITVSHYRASTSDIMRRILEESRAGRVGADVTIGGPGEKAQLDNENLLATFDSPYAEQIFDAGVTPTGLGVYRTMRIPLWNTDRIAESGRPAPSTWEEVLENYPGELVLDPTDWDWFATFTQEYLMKEKGMTEDEAIAYWTEVAKGAVVIAGHTLGGELVASGEYTAVAVAYQHRLPPEGAPVAWEPAMFPVIESNTFVSILHNTERPATSLLLTEFIVSDAQTMLYETGGYTPANTTAPSAWPTQYEDLVIPTNPDLFTDEGEANRWMDLYEQVLTGSKPGQ